MELVSGAHCRYQIRYHVVWGVKYSHELLIASRAKYLKQVLSTIADNYDYTLVAVGTDEDHVHVFVGAQPEIAPAKLIQTLKSISAKQMFTAFPEIKKYLWGGALWRVGYYVRTVSDGPLEKTIEEYVVNQGKLGKKGRQLKLVP